MNSKLDTLGIWFLFPGLNTYSYKLYTYIHDIEYHIFSRFLCLVETSPISIKMCYFNLSRIIIVRTTRSDIIIRIDYLTWYKNYDNGLGTTVNNKI